MTDTNTTESENETANSLTERVRQLEAQVSKQQSTIERLMPSRRDILKAGAGGVVGAVALSGSSSASTGSAGTIGSQSDRPDIFADTVDTQSVSGNTLYAGAFPGSDPDSRLDSALSQASRGSTIILEQTTTGYTDARTIATNIELRGNGFRSGTRLEGDITFDGFVTVSNLALRGDATFNSQANVTGCDFFNASHTVDGARCVFIGCRAGSVTFSSSASDCTAVGCVNVTFQNNGSNIVITGNA